MVKFRKTERAKEKFYAAKKPIKIWDVLIMPSFDNAYNEWIC